MDRRLFPALVSIVLALGLSACGDDSIPPGVDAGGGGGRDAGPRADGATPLDAFVGDTDAGPPPSGMLIPPDRLAPWRGNVGVEDGIVHRTDQVDCTAAPYRAHHDGSDTSAEIQACLDGIAAEQVAYLPAGTYVLSSSISIPSHRTLRGAGPDITTLSFADGAGRDVQFTGGYTDAASDPGIAISSGYTQGSPLVTLADASSFAIGDLLYIAEINDPSIPVDISNDDSTCDYCGLNGTDGTRARLQLSKVTGISGNMLMIDPPMLMTFTAPQDPRAYRSPADFVDHAGIEALTVANAAGSSNDMNVWMQGARNCWVSNVKIQNCGNRCIELWDDVYRNEIRDSYFTGCIDHVNSDNCYGVEIWAGTGNLVENNIFDHTSDSVILVSASGNVFGYNYAVGVHRDSADWFWPDSWTHGSHSSYNLWEGNDGNALEWDEYFGSNSHDMAFRNRYHGMDATVTYDLPALQSAGAILRYPNQTFMTEIGNVLGTAGFATVYEASSYGVEGVRPIWSTMTSAMGITSDKNVRTNLRHMNFDYFTMSVKHCDEAGEPGCQGGDASTILPASLYLAARPSWFGAAAYPPIGPDVTGMATAIPAATCHAMVASGGTFDARTCYGAP